MASLPTVGMRITVLPKSVMDLYGERFALKILPIRTER